MKLKRNVSGPLYVPAVTIMLWGVMLLAAGGGAQAAPFAYAASPAGVTVIDTATDTVTATVPTPPGGAGQSRVAVNATGTRVYVATTHTAAGDPNSSVSVFDTATNTIVATIPVAGRAQGVAVNPAGTRVYVTHADSDGAANPTPDGVLVLDTTSNSVITDVPIARHGVPPRDTRPNPFGVVVNPAGTRVYVANLTGNDDGLGHSGTVSVLNTATNTIIDTVRVGVQPFGVGNPIGVAINPAGTQVYVTNQAPNTVSVLDTATDTVSEPVRVGIRPHGVAVNPTGTRVYVANFVAGSFSTIKTSDPCDTAVETQLFGNIHPVGIAVNPAGTRLYLATADKGIFVFDLATNRITGAINAGDDIAFAPGVAPPVDPVPPAPIRVTGIEVTQGIQDLANSVPLVSGRRTFVRVHVVSDGPAVPGVTATLTGLGAFSDFRGSSVFVPLEALIPVNTVGSRLTVSPQPKRSNLDDSFLFELPWQWVNFESLRLNAVLSADPGPPRHTCRSDFDDAPIHEFKLLTTLSIQFVRLGYKLPNTNTLLAASLAEQSLSESWIRRAYPLTTLVPTPDFFLFDAGLGTFVSRAPCLLSPPDQQNLCAHGYITSQLASLQILTGFMGRADAAYGLIPQVPRANDPKANFFTRGACCTNRIGAGPSPTLIVDPPPPPQNTDVLFEDYAAHEIGHQLGRQHPVEGSELCNHSADDPNYPYFLTFIGTGILGPVVSDPATDLAGFDGGDASNLIPVTFHYAQNAFDVMGYCGGTRRNRQWISDYTYKGLYLSLLALHPDISRRASFAAGIASVAGTRTAAAQSSDLLLVSGNIAPTLARAELLRTVRVDRVVSTPPRTPGNYSIRLKGAAGVTLADYSFTPETVEDVKTIGGANSPLLGFTHVVPFVTGTTEIQIVDASRASPVIGRKTVSPSPPAIHDVALLGQPDPTTGALTVDWTASDSDGDPLTFDVFFVRAGGALLQPLMLGLPGPSVQVDTSRLGGGTAQFRVVATDGVNSAAADTPPFILPNKPPQPRILTVGDGMKIHAGQMLNLEGAATDPQDGTIPDTGFTWRTQRGSLGAGSRISVADLPVGVTQITLTATNSLGLAASTTVAVTVAENLDRPGPTLTVGPTQIGWQVAVGETQPQTAELDISNSGSGKLEFRASSSAPWLTLSTTTGTAPATLTLTANPRGFAGGTTQEAGVTLAAVGLPGQTITIPVRISVGNTFSNGNPTTSTLDRPRVSGVIVAKGLHAPGILFVDLRLTNTGASRIRNLMVQQLALRTLLGSGAVTLNTLSPAFPKVIGDVNIGTSTTLRLFLNVPPTVKRFSLTENGTAQNVAGTSFTYSVGQAVTP